MTDDPFSHAADDWLPIAETGLEIVCSDRDDSVFERFFAGYDRAFVLPNEKEEADGFRTCLALNHGAERTRLAAEFGPFREVCLIARDAEDRTLVGGANFIALEVPDDHEPVISANLNYIYVDANLRGKGYFGRLVRAVRHAVPLSLGRAGEALIFIEQNDPLRMSAEDYARDTAFTGLDQLDRMRIWAKQGAKVIDHPYVQPPLTAEADPDDNLIYGVLSDRADIAACTLHEHLRKFFGISVLKGAPLGQTEIAARQVRALAALCADRRRIALLDPKDFLARTPDRTAAEALFSPYPASTREAIKRMQRAQTPG
jgi:GNAT superfamily N-acetyltransferase